ncbi:unnamed protein product [Blepharisma stoltei]|uniref:Uncharacterized protein n=1 Tax=Blepharisma stoltei TaxID=1481888 RepID=A0AAU9IBE8_9CILI|nr:unnamed protein product [Blepharisma stoltei]
MEEEPKINSFDMIKELHEEHKSPFENSEIEEMQKKLKISRKKQEDFKYKSVLSQELMQELKQKFQNSLNKLNSIDTRDVATREVRLLIERNSSMEALKIYIGCLSEHRKAKSPLAREQEVLLLGYISQVYEDRLIEDKNSPLRILVRLAEIIQMYFKDLNRKVHEAAAISMCMIYKFSLPKNSQQIVFTFMFEPLNSILLSGIDVQAQQAAALVIFKWAELLVQEKDIEILYELLQRTIGLFLKLRADFADLVSAIGLMIETIGFQAITESIILLLSKLIQYLKCTSNYGHLLKIEACRLLYFISVYLRENGGFELEQVFFDVINALKDVRTDKLPLVQTSAREALKGWELLISEPKILKKSDLKDSIELPQIKQQPKSIFPNHFKNIRNLVKIQKEKSQKANFPIVEKGQKWGISKHGFLKRGSGQFSYIESEGVVDINRALDKRPSVKEYLQKRINSAPPRESVEILFKKDHQLSVYKRHEAIQEENMDLFVEEKIAGDERVAPWKKEEENKFEKPIESGNNLKNSGEFIIRKKTVPKVPATLTGEENPKEPQEVYFLHERQESQFVSPDGYQKMKSQNSISEFKPTPSSLLTHSVELKSSLDGDSKLKNPQVTPDSSISYSKSDIKEKIDSRSAKESSQELEKKPLKNEINVKESLSSPRSVNLESIKKANPDTGLRAIKFEDPPIQNEEIGSQISRDNQLPIEKAKINAGLIWKASGNQNSSEKIQQIEYFKPAPKAKKLEIQQQSQIFNYIPKKQENKQKDNRQAADGLKNSKIKENIEFSQQFIDSLENIEKFELKKSFIHPAQSDNENITNFNEAFKKSCYELQGQMEQDFDLMANKLGQIEGRIDSAQEALYLLSAYNELSSKEEEIIEKTSPKAMWTQTLISTEIQTSFINHYKEENKAKISHKNSLSSQNSNKSIQVEPTEFSIENKNPQDILARTWSSTIKNLDAKNVNTAYKSILDTGDDIYLLRLMHKTGPCLRKFSENTARAVLKRLGLILNSNFIENIGLNWILESIELGHIKSISSDEKAQLVEALDKMSCINDEEGQMASELSTYIQADI